ncbi:hypothetical protein A6B39_10370 [Mannheimia granulomatis]|uniref:hypothetical protein n=1 Tax=Mannheimia granulomatis TaxID=85402 RepID=UPI00159E4E14|nr:hypothetical protein [Mannheimia granulomatis]QLB15823.1 hypothetical protein A6B39_10370 [Mannheimia granulomatis]
MKAKYLVSLATMVPLLATAEENTTWVDKQHATVSNKLDSWADNINTWLGETDPNKPGTASLRIMLDSQWNKHDKFTYKPRVRGKIKLPVLKKHLNVVFGDDELDNEITDKTHVGKMYKNLPQNKRYNSREARDSNSSIGLRWSDNIKALGIETDLDGGIRSGSDIFGRLRISKEWQITDQFSTRLEQIYRYGTESKHYLRTNFENKYQETDTTFIMNHTHFEYRHDVDEERSWGNSLYRQHNFKPLSHISYGISFGGRLDKDLSRFNHWGPFVSYRQPIWRNWLFVQPEISFYNDKDNNRKHFINTFVRLEAIF